MMKKIIFVLSVVGVLFGVGGYFYLAPYHKGIVHVGGHYFFVEVVGTPEEWRQGLSGRESMCGRCGMLFDFREEREATFWMKDMRFDIDILWVRDGEIVRIAENVSHTTPLQTYASHVPVDMVLELPAGTAKEYSIIVGDVLDL